MRILNNYYLIIWKRSSASERPQYKIIPKAVAIHYLNVCHSGKSRSRPAKR